MSNIINKFENKLKGSTILAVLVISDQVDFKKIELNFGELLLLDIPPIVPESVLSVSSFLVQIAVEKLSQDAKVTSSFFQFINKSEKNKNEIGMLISVGNFDFDDNIIMGIQSEFESFLLKIGGEGFFSQNTCSPVVKNQVNNFLTNFGSKRIHVPFGTFLSKSEPVSFKGTFVEKPHEQDSDEGELFIEGTIDCPSHKKKTFSINGDKCYSGIHFELSTFFSVLALNFMQRTYMKFTISSWKRNGKDRLTLKGLEVLEGPQKLLDL